MAEETELQEIQADIASVRSSMAQTVAELRGLVVGMLSAQGRFKDTNRRNMKSATDALKQQGSVPDYINQFYNIFNGTNFSEEFSMNLFLMGVREEIQSVVRKFNPKTLHQAASLAKLREQAITLASKQSSLPSTNTSFVEEMEFKLKETKPSSNDSKFAFIPSQHLNVTEPQSSIRSLSTDVSIGGLEVLGELSKSQELKIVANNPELKLFDEMPEKEFLKKEVENYRINGCPNIRRDKPQDLKKELNEIGKCSQLKNYEVVIKFKELQVFDEMSNGNIIEKGIEWCSAISCSRKVLSSKNIERQDLVAAVTIYECLKSSSLRVACVGGLGDKGLTLCLKTEEQPQTPLPPPEPPPQRFVVWVNVELVVCGQVHCKSNFISCSKRKLILMDIIDFSQAIQDRRGALNFANVLLTF